MGVNLVNDGVLTQFLRHFLL